MPVSLLPSGAPLPFGARVTDGILSAEVRVAVVRVLVVITVMDITLMTPALPRVDISPPPNSPSYVYSFPTFSFGPQ